MKLSDHDLKYGYGKGGKGFSQTLGSGYSKRILLPSGVFSLDLAHGIGGIWTGSVVRLMGPPSTGKSSISYRLIAEGLRAGMSALIIDTEWGMNEAILMDTLEEYGLDPNDPDLPFRYCQATNWANVKLDKNGQPTLNDTKPILTLERAIPMINEWVTSKDISPKGAIIVIDSLDLVLSDAMVGSDVDDATVALIARRMKNWLRLFTGTICGTGSMLVLVHQITSTIGSMGDNVVFTGGNAVAHAAHVTIRLKDIGQEKSGEEIVGRNIKGFIVKSKQGIAYKTFEYVLRSDIGPDNVGAVFEIAKKLKFITASGAWVTIPGVDSPIQGKEAVRNFWIENPENFMVIKNMILDAASTHKDEVFPEDDETRVAAQGDLGSAE